MIIALRVEVAGFDHRSRMGVYRSDHFLLDSVITVPDMHGKNTKAVLRQCYVSN